MIGTENDFIDVDDEQLWKEWRINNKNYNKLLFRELNISKNPSRCYRILRYLDLELSREYDSLSLITTHAIYCIHSSCNYSNTRKYFIFKGMNIDDYAVV